MGTTLLTLILQDEMALYGHVGDSRLYLLRQKHLMQLTADDTLVNEMNHRSNYEMGQREALPYKHILTKAIGTNPHIDLTPEKIELEDQDLFLLCSDGLTNELPDRILEKVLLSEDSLENKAHTLLSKAKEAGGSDNITLIVVQVVV